MRHRIYCYTLVLGIAAATIFAVRGHLRQIFYEYVAAQDAKDWKQKTDAWKRKDREEYLELLIENATPLELNEAPGESGAFVEGAPGHRHPVWADDI